MSDTSLHKRLDLLDARSKSVKSSELSELRAIQAELDAASEELTNHKQLNDYAYLVYEIQSRLHFAQGQYDEANRACKEAVRLAGAEYPDATWLKHLISKARLAESDMSSNKYTMQSLRKDKANTEKYLSVALLGLFIFVPFFLMTYNDSNRKTERIESCISDISSLQESMEQMNSSFDEISYEASNAAGNGYDDQEYSLDKVASMANDSKIEAQATSCTQDDEDYSSN